LNPKWKGKIVSLAPTDFGIGAPLQFMYYHPELGPEYIRKFFGGMDLTFSRDNRQMTDWLASGKFAICLGCRGTDRAKRQGLPVESFNDNGWKEGGYFTVGGGSLSLINRAQHPNAAKVFINWFLSREGQTAAQRLLNPDSAPSSLRLDVPKENVPEENRLVEGGKYFDVTRPEYADMTPIFKLVREIMQAREKKVE
jgi:iron(III) transport system substrate-binding protein